MIPDPPDPGDVGVIPDPPDPGDFGTHRYCTTVGAAVPGGSSGWYISAVVPDGHSSGL